MLIPCSRNAHDKMSGNDTRVVPCSRSRGEDGAC